MKILITGSNGMLGHDLIKVLKPNHELILTNSKNLDITDKDKTINFIRENSPDLVINAAAYTDVDDCEDNQNRAFSVNAEGVKNLAIGCKEVDCPLLQISTDYVFKGNKSEPLVEDDEIGPISVYGKSKLQAEESIVEILEKYFIIRTAWLYGVNGKNFPKTMLELSKNNKEISVVYDEIGSPTYTLDLANAISDLIETDYYGIYHLTNSDYCSWCEFAKYIFKIANKDINVIPVTASEFARLAPRPSYSVLKNKNWTDKGFAPLRSYKEAIVDYIKLIDD